jgi:phosphate transport system protein
MPSNNTTHLQREIQKLKHQIVALSAEVEHTIEGAYQALESLDVAKANAVIAADAAIDQLEVDLEEECLKIMALYQPVASDLRMVIGVLKMNSDLERMGDLSGNIAEYIGEIAKLPPIDIPPAFRQLFDATLSQVRKALDALVNADAGLAREVCLGDDAVDALNREIILAVRQRLITEPHNAPALLFLISISRSVERIADYATNIAEDVYYMVQGRIVRHHVREVLGEAPPPPAQP